MIRWLNKTLLQYQYKHFNLFLPNNILRGYKIFFEVLKYLIPAVFTKIQATSYAVYLIQLVNNMHEPESIRLFFFKTSLCYTDLRKEQLIYQ